MTKPGMIKAMVCLIPLVVSCGTSNVNKLFGAKDDSYASLLQRAELAYDLGDFSTAETLANQAYDRSENNGDAGVLLGSIYLSQAGIDIFQMVSKLSSLSSSSSSSTTSSCSSSSSSTTSSTNILSELSCKLLSLSDADIAALGTNTAFSGLSSVGITSVYIPNEVDDTLRAKVSVLAALDKGVKKLCPFISRDLVISKSTDSRHTNKAACPDYTSTSYNSAKAHISFALLNLVEALVMQRGILIDATSSATSNQTGINTVSGNINKATFTSPTQFATALTSYKTIVDSIFATTKTNSQISLALNGLLAVTHSFTAAGMPASVTKSIDTQLSALQAMASKLGDSSSSVNQSKALQGQINEQYAKTMAAKINTTCANNACSASDITSLCASYTGISTGVDSTKITKPTVCN